MDITGKDFFDRCLDFGIKGYKVYLKMTSKEIFSLMKDN
jgi:hypothetical protein